jgi:IclR family acetate operon transcriptional repressor
VDDDGEAPAPAGGRRAAGASDGAGTEEARVGATTITTERGAGGRHGVRSVQRALRVVEVVAAGPTAGMALTAIAAELGLSKSTVLASARTLVAEGVLRTIEPGPRYKLGTALIRYGDLASQQSPVGEVCLDILREASEATGMTARLAVAEAGYPVCVQRVDGPGMVRFQVPLGRREPPHATAAGKSLLAMLSRERVLEICAESGLPRHTARTITDIETLFADLAAVRRRGYAIDDEEELLGVFCVGAPFFDHSGECAGAISVTGIRQDLPDWKVAELGRLLRRLADDASKLLGGSAYTAPLDGDGAGAAAGGAALPAGLPGATARRPGAA